MVEPHAAATAAARRTAAIKYSRVAPVFLYAGFSPVMVYTAIMPELLCRSTCKTTSYSVVRSQWIAQGLGHGDFQSAFDYCRRTRRLHIFILRKTKVTRPPIAQPQWPMRFR